MRRIASIFIILCSFILICLFTVYSAGKQSTKITLREDFNLGEESVDDNYVFANISHIALDSNENIYLLDRKNFRIQIFDDKGKFLKSVEIKKGQGPEEVTLPFGMAVTEKGKIYVSDYSGKKILVFDEKGEFLHSFNLDFQAIYFKNFFPLMFLSPIS